VEPVDRHDAPAGEQIVAVDLVAAGVDDLVLVSSEGRFARELFGLSAPVRSTIVAIIDGIEFET
jgi:microcompartment protein CcmK/EutM